MLGVAVNAGRVAPPAQDVAGLGRHREARLGHAWALGQHLCVAYTHY